MERIIQVLRRFNYTETEAKVYMALLQNGIQTAKKKYYHYKYGKKYQEYQYSDSNEFV